MLWMYGTESPIILEKFTSQFNNLCDFVRIHNVGVVHFLAIEGKPSPQQQKTLASTNRQRDSTSTRTTSDNVTLSRVAESAALFERQKTVENIWDITVSLNILYRENWTR